LLLAATLVVLNFTARSEAEQKAGFTTEDTEDTEGKAEVPFVVGASRFDEGDKISIRKVRGTASDFEPGGTYWIEGSYTLASRDKASLSAFVTAKNADDGKTSIDEEQTMTVERGSGTFSLKLRMPYEGWPHVSFYPDGGGDGFGGVYFGTGDSVLTEWWDEKDVTTEGTESTVEKSEAKSPTAGLEESLEKKISFCVALFNAPGRSGDLRDLYKKFQDEGRTIYLYGYTVDPNSPAGKRFGLTGAPTCIVFQHGQETGRLDMIQTREQLVRFVEAESQKKEPLDGKERDQNDDWLKSVVFASPKEGEVSRRAKELLGVRIVPAAEDELRAARQKGFAAALKILDPIAKGPVADAPVILVSLHGVVIADYAVLDQMLAEISNRRMNEGLTQVKVGGVVGDREFLSTIELPRLESVEIRAGKSGDSAAVAGGHDAKANPGDLGEYVAAGSSLPAATASGKFPTLEEQKTELTTEDTENTGKANDATAETVVKKLGYLIPNKISDEAAKRDAEQIAKAPGIVRAWVGRGPLESRLLLIEYKTSATAPTMPQVVWNLEEEGNSRCEVSFVPAPATNPPRDMALQTTSANKFPSLEEQKLADLAYRRLGIELEQIGAGDLERVKALGYDGGVSVTGTNRPGNQRYDFNRINSGDILVGLHVWPTKSLRDVADVLDRDDLAELNPIKYYVVRDDPSDADRDLVFSGRISAALDQARGSRATASANRYSEAPARPKAAAGKPSWPAIDPQPAAGLPVPTMPNAVARREEGRSANVVTRVTPEGKIIEEAPPDGSKPREPVLTEPSSASMPLSKQDRENLLKGGRIRIELFYAPDSGPCQRALELIPEYEKAFPGLIEIQRIDVTADPKAAGKAGIGGVLPAYKLYQGDLGIQTTSGVMRLEQLEAALAGLARRGISHGPAATPATARGSEAIASAKAAIPLDVRRALVARGPLTLEVFYVDNSEPCRKARDMVRDFARNHLSLPLKVDMKNAEIHRAEAVRHGITNAPALVWLHDGEVVHQSVGTSSMSEFANELIAVARKLPEKKAEKLALRYDGKSFDDWRTEWQTELSTAKRVEAVKALAAFGRAGYGKEAAAVILDVAGEYDFTFMQHDNDANGKLKQAVVEVLSPESGRPSLAEFWLPGLVERTKDDPGKWRPLLAYAVGQLRSDNPQVIGLLRTLAVEGPAEVRGSALGALVRSERISDRTGSLSEETRKLLAAALTSDDLDQRRSALWLLVYDPNNPWTLGWNGMGDARLFYLPEIVGPLLGADEELRQRARLQLQYVQAKDAPALVEQLLKILNDDSRAAEHVETIRAIAAMGPAGVAATEELKKIVLEGEKDGEAISAILALACVNEKGVSTKLSQGGLNPDQVLVTICDPARSLLTADNKRIEELNDAHGLKLCLEHEAQEVFPESRPRPGGGIF